MDDLAAFVEARLADDMALALLASPGPWYLNAESDEVVAVDDISVAEVFALSNNQLRNTAAFIASHDPARVLRDVEAKRQMLRYVRGELADDETDQSALWLLQMLAAPHADHPDFRSEWLTEEDDHA